MSYLLQIDGKVVGPLTEYQVLAKFDAGEIDLVTRITRSETPDLLNKDDCLTLDETNLYKKFDTLRKIVNQPTNYYLDQIIENQKLQINILKGIRWALFGFAVWLTIQFLILPALQH